MTWEEFKEPFKKGDAVTVPVRHKPYHGKGIVSRSAVWAGEEMVCVYVDEHSRGYIWVKPRRLKRRTV